MIFRSCPAHLEVGLTRAVLDQARANYLDPNTTSMSPTGDGDGKKNEKIASSEDLSNVTLRPKDVKTSVTSSATSTKGSQGKDD